MTELLISTYSFMGVFISKRQRQQQNRMKNRTEWHAALCIEQRLSSEQFPPCSAGPSVALVLPYASVSVHYKFPVSTAQQSIRCCSSQESKCLVLVSLNTLLLLLCYSPTHVVHCHAILVETLIFPWNFPFSPPLNRYSH